MTDAIMKSSQPALVAFSIAASPLPNSVIDPSMVLPTTDCTVSQENFRQDTGGRRQEPRR